MKRIYIKFIFCSVLFSALSLHSCTLEEYNPGAFTKEALATGSNGFGDGEMLQAFIAEAVFTFIFVLVVLGSTDSKKGAGNLAGLAIGLTLVLVHIVCIPITGTSVNPARSIAPALFQGGEALSQLWLFIIAPFVGAALSAVVWNYLGDKK